MSDWLGDPPTHDGDISVPCPFCGVPFRHLDTYESHLHRVHRLRNLTVRPPRRPTSRLVRTLAALRFVPLWLVVLVGIPLWRMLGEMGLIATMAVMAMVVWAQSSRALRSG
jgi:uncharacterized C2H2 Zn-finger protein